MAKNAKNKKTNSNLLTSLLYIAIGIILCVFPNDALELAMTLAGIFFIISGALDLLRLHFFGGAINLIIGIAILVLGWTVTGIVLLVLGILIAIKGVLSLLSVFTKKNKNALDLVFSALMIVVGLMLAFGNVLAWMVIVVGVLLALDGLLGLINSFKKS